MSEYKICTICGGIVGNAILHTTLTTTSTASVPPITFCPGHSTTTVGHFPIYGETGPEHLYVPQVSSTFPPDLDAFWQIAQEVAGADVAGYNDIEVCPFCGNGECYMRHGEEFPHTSECIVTKARALMEWRKAQPHMTVNIKKDDE